ncbi:hypothetical protein Q6U62_003591 [Vibrio parahaemolyticus]|nr:hypothetical protein [Vibrio parahaemolyticus]ELB2939312.1 hypothetical protein [Vibrio alginolyticus]EGR1985685.1 methionyl-tRNA formyltransferase [Vibrio parahaemolyticus]EII3443331.1 hypothetical protein [Vibrio parahaemolyticus]EIV1640565.1 hypothetical protein [Vibrio parahaemolyticus]EJC1078410.1 hypothetical protein [Vibrio parahaemolyticus]
MAIVRKMENITLERDSSHSEVNATYTVVVGDNGEKYLQVDTYGSTKRQEIGKKSQSVRFSPEAIEQLKSIIAAL